MKNTLQKIWFAARWLLFLGILISLSYYFSSLVREVKVAPGNSEVIFFTTQNDADCILIYNSAAAILIDTAEIFDANSVISQINALGINTLDFLILTHPDLDHIGGAMEIISNFEIKHVVMPNYQKENKALAEIETELILRRIPITFPTRNRKFTIGDISLIVYPPLEKFYNIDNNYSLATLLTIDNINMVFPGDAEEKRLHELFEIHWPTVDLLKIPHHGRSNASSEAFITKLSPKVAVSTSNIVDKIIHNTCKEIGCELFTTNELRENVCFFTDGKTLTKK